MCERADQPATEYDILVLLHNPYTMGFVEEVLPDGIMPLVCPLTRNDIVFDEWDEELSQPLINAHAEDIQQVISCVQKLMNGCTLFEENVKKSWWLYLKPLYNVLKFMTDIIDTHDNLCHWKRFKIFNLLPICHFKHCYIFFDTTCLYKLAHKVHLLPDLPSSWETSNQRTA